ncbi:MAG TPA: endonuclease/exonuclease/phosphatase family protein [Terriglobales bacterium]|nr:endonuclease/exonuclease/phosphatase family protein [Terriglobales bacterium]
MSPNQNGVALISRWPIRATRNRRLSTAHDTPDARVALLDEVSTSNWTKPDSRALLVGDLNGDEDEPAIHLAK